MFDLLEFAYAIILIAGLAACVRSDYFVAFRLGNDMQLCMCVYTFILILFVCLRRGFVRIINVYIHTCNYQCVCV